ncbi:MAG: 50S ribosomal protein L3 [Candidatus Woesearchaeota archaeon]
MKKVNPRHGSMQFWPRKKAARCYARVRALPTVKDAKPLVFAGYKVGMTHVIAVDTKKTSITKGEQLALPVTILECPNLKIASVRFYKPNLYGTSVSKELFFKHDKEVSRKTNLSKNLSTLDDLKNFDLTGVVDITVQVYTQPKSTFIGKKTPEIFEVSFGGSNEDKLKYISEHIESGISIKDVFSEGSFVDLRSVTKGKGYQGPVKRFGIGLRSHKSEKTKRGAGSLGPWKGQGHIMYRVAYAGQMGFHQRTQYNNYILNISDDISKVNPKGGFINCGNVKSTYVLIKGSIPGAKKRLVMMTSPLRETPAASLPSIEYVSVESKQGN